jgi:hypothetical protein
MAIVRFSTEEVFNCDSQEYDILRDAALNIRGVAGGVVEIGTRRGGSAKIIIDALAENKDTDRAMFCIDPYGNIEIECTNLNMSIHYPGTVVEGDPNSKDITSPHRFDYTNDMRNRVIPSLYYYAYMSGLNFTFFCLEDVEFFKRYYDGVPVYDQEKKLINKYAFVFFDGPHFDAAIMRELEFFTERSVRGSTFVFDDIWMANHEGLVEPYLFERGFELLQKGQIKASYVRTI